MSYSLKILNPTWFKQDTEQSVVLSIAQKVLIEAGQVFPISSFAPSQSQHVKFSLGKNDQGKQLTLQGKNTWYAYSPHVQMLKDGKPFSAADVPSNGAIGAAGLELIKSFEGCILDAYQDCVGVWTIGYGSTGSHVYPGLSITQQEAEDLLKQDLSRFEKAVSSFVTVPINGNQFDALVSFAYNLGEGALQGSTLLWLLNQGDYAGAADEFLKWASAGGEILAGLVRRRKAERSLFLSQNYTQYL